VLQEHVAALLQRWAAVRGDEAGGRRVWLLLLDEAQLAPRAVSAMLRAVYAWNFPAAAPAFSHSVAIIPIVVGTSAAEIIAEDNIRATGYSPWMGGAISLPFLSPPKAALLLRHLLERVHVQESNFILHLAGEFSGWPIAFSFLHTALDEHVRALGSAPAGGHLISKESCVRLYDEVVQRIGANYSAEKLTGMVPEYIRTVIRMALVGMEVTCQTAQ